ncbi:hypothetical protein INR49_011702 [Caranx melampygus]|nr:hypothetical protein INR49_011702 [Caranx melampygus]
MDGRGSSNRAVMETIKADRRWKRQRGRGGNNGSVITWLPPLEEEAVWGERRRQRRGMIDGAALVADGGRWTQSGEELGV